MTLQTKLRLSTALISSFTLILGGVALFSLDNMEKQQMLLAGQAIPSLMAISEMDGLMKDVRGRARAHVVATDAAEKKSIEKELQALRTKFDEGANKFRKEFVTPRDAEHLRAVSETAGRFIRVWETEVRPQSESVGQAVAMPLFLSKGMAAFKDTQQALNALRDVRKLEAADAAKESAATSNQARLWLALMFAASLIAAIATDIFQTRRIAASLRGTISRLAEAADQLAETAGHVTSASNSLAQGASEQSCTISEVVATGDQVRASATKNMESAVSATSVMGELTGDVADVNSTLSRMNESMSEIAQAGQRIARIIRVIEEIAFQTNILALNAAVEAARAGDAGMGFSVVAGEVRNLAQRCAEAARDTQELIESSVRGSETGQSRLAEVREVVERMTEHAAMVGELLSPVKAGSEHQAQSLEQISASLLSVETVTQTAAAAAEESAAAAEELASQATILRTSVNTLRAMVESRA